MVVTERQFKIVPRRSIISAIIPAVFLAFSLFSAAAALIAGQMNFLVRYWPMLAIMGVGGLVGLIPLLVLSHTIVLRETETRFLGLRKVLVVRRGEATSLKPAAMHQGAFELRTTHGRATFPSRFTGFHEVVATLKTQNPQMTITDC
jgi:hypothetical protein